MSSVLQSRLDYRFAALLAAGALLAVASAQLDTDQVFDEALKSMMNRQAEIDNLMLKGLVGEQFNGFLGIPPGTALAPEQEALLQEENAERNKVYAAMAELMGGKPAEAASQRAKRYLARYRKGIMRQAADGSWSDGMTREERLAGYKIELGEVPEEVQVSSPFQLSVRVVNAAGGSANLDDLTNAFFQVRVEPSDLKLSGLLKTSAKDGKASFPDLQFTTQTSSARLEVTLLVPDLPAASHPKTTSAELRALPRTLRPDEIRALLPKFRAAIEREKTNAKGTDANLNLGKLRAQLALFRDVIRKEGNVYQPELAEIDTLMEQIGNLSE